MQIYDNILRTKSANEKVCETLYIVHNQVAKEHS